MSNILLYPPWYLQYSLERVVFVNIFDVQDSLLQMITCILHLLQLPWVIILNCCMVYHILLALNLEVYILQTCFILRRPSSGFLHCVIWYKLTNISEVLAAYDGGSKYL